MPRRGGAKWQCCCLTLSIYLSLANRTPPMCVPSAHSAFYGPINDTDMQCTLTRFIRAYDIVREINVFRFVCGYSGVPAVPGLQTSSRVSGVFGDIEPAPDFRTPACLRAARNRNLNASKSSTFGREALRRNISNQANKRRPASPHAQHVYLLDVSRMAAMLLYRCQSAPECSRTSRKRARAKESACAHARNGVGVIASGQIEAI